MYMSIAGIIPVDPGFARVRIRPQPATLERLELVVPSVRGDIRFRSEGNVGGRTIAIGIPETCIAEIVLPDKEKVDLRRRTETSVPGTVTYDLPSGRETVVKLRYT